MTHSLPPKPPPSAHDRVEQRKDSRNKRKTEKGGRHKGPRENHPRDTNSGKNSSNKKKGQQQGHQQQGHQPHTKSPTRESSNLESEGLQEEQAPIEAEPALSVRDGDEHCESPKPEQSHDEQDHDESVLGTVAHESVPESAVDQKADEGKTPRSPEQVQYEAPQIDQAEEENPPREQEQLGTTPESALVRDHEGLTGSSDAPVTEEVAELAAVSRPKTSSSQNTSQQEDRTAELNTAVSPGIPNGDNQALAHVSKDEKAMKRGRSIDDYHRDTSPEYPRHHMVTESNLRSLEQSHHHQLSNSGPTSSDQRDHRGLIKSRRRRRSESDDGSRRHSRRSSISSRSSGLDSLEAELLGRPSKVRSDDTAEPHEKLHEKTSKAKRRRPNIDSAYR